MQKKRRYLSVVGQIVCLFIVAAMLGCGDTPRRASGKKLRSVTKKAKMYYDKAQSLLSNYDDGYDKPEVLRALGDAEKLLVSALQKNGKRGDAEDTPEGEIVNARTMLGMVYQLRGMCNLWKIDAAIREIDLQQSQTHALLTKVQALSAGALSYQQSFLTDMDDIQKTLSKARSDQKVIADKSSALNSTIKKQTEKIKALEKKIQNLSIQSASLQKDSAVNVSREASLRKLREAQSVEGKIIDNEVILARQQRELIAYRNKMAILQIKLEELNGQVNAYQARSLSMEKAEKERKSNLNARENKIKNCWTNILASQKSPLKEYPGASPRSLVQNCQLVVKLSARGQNDFDKAKREFMAAGRVEGSKNTLLLEDQAEALIGKAMILTRVMNLHNTIKILSDRTQTVWKNTGKPQISVGPVLPEITKFLKQTDGVIPKLTDSYKQAVKLRESLVRKTRGVKPRRQCQKALINTYEAYARSLIAAGNSKQGAAEMKKAEELKTKISKSD